MAELGNLYVIAAPSGTGKTTLVKALVDSVPRITVSISHTTRPKRGNEMHGVNYYFVDNDEFKRMIGTESFLEYAMIFANYYGTSKRWVTETLAKGMDVVLEIDWQGHQQIKRLFPAAIGIFVLPPSVEDLRQRLVKRDQDHPEIIQQRLADARETVVHVSDFEYVVINDDFTHALQELKTIIEAERLKQARQTAKYSHLINDLKSFLV